MKRSASLSIAILILATAITGCTTGVAINPTSDQAEQAEYRAGTLHAPAPANAREVFRTAIREMDEMGYYRTGERHEEDQISIFARNVNDEKVKVRIRQLEGGQSELRIRVGTFGDLAESQRIYGNIRSAL